MSTYWNDRNRPHVQTNNPTEEQLRKDELEEGGDVKGWLETCGPTAMVNCLDALGVDIEIVTPGGFKPQPEEIAADYFNDPRNYGKFSRIRSDLDFSAMPGNRIPNLYPLAAMDVFGARGMFYLARGWDLVVADLILGYTAQLCLKNPGHYIAAVGFDKTTGEIIYHDSWPGRTGTDGFALRMGRDEFARNVQDAVIVYTGGKA